MRNSGYQNVDMDNLKEKELDAALESQSQMAMRAVVQSLPEDEPSLAWRSSLNERLQVQVARRKKIELFGWIWKPAAGVALAGALAFVFLLRTEPNFIPSTPSSVQNAGSIEEALIATHRESGGGLSEVTGAGLTPTEYFGDQTKGPVEDPIWQEIELGTL